MVKPLILCFIAGVVRGGKVRSAPSAWSIQGASTVTATAAPGSVSAKRIGVEFSVIKVSENKLDYKPIPLLKSNSRINIYHNWRVIEIKTHSQIFRSKLCESERER